MNKNKEKVESKVIELLKERGVFSDT